jgi:hypothetical protein
VFQAYLTTFLIEPGYEEPIRNIEELLKSEKKFGLREIYKEYIFLDPSDPVDSTIVRDAVQCPDQPTCFLWAAVYHNISTVLQVMDMDIYRAMGQWIDENNRHLLCEFEGGFVKTFNYAIMVMKGAPFLEFIDEVLSHILEGGIFMHIKEGFLDKLKMESKLDIPTSADTYYAISIGHQQTTFYLLILGYVLVVVCFVTEIIWHRYSSKGRGPAGTCFGHGKK